MAKRVAGRLMLWGLVLGIGIGALVYWANREPVIEVTTMAVSRGPVEQTVSAISSGTVKSDRKALVAADTIGIVEAVPVRIGTRVKQGDMLLELHHADLDAQVALAEANLRVTESRLEQAKATEGIHREVSAAEVGQAAAQLDQAENDFERAKALKAEKAIAESDYDAASVKLRVAREAHAAAQATGKESTVRAEDVRSAKALVEQAQASLDVAKTALAKATIRAPFDGVVADLHIDVGEAVVVGKPLVYVVQDEALYVEAPFDEADAALLKPGQQARITVDAYRETEFAGKVTRISPAVTLNEDLSRTLDVRIELTDMAEKLMAGMSADVMVLIDAKEEALYVPSETLVRDEFVYVVEDGRIVRRPVTLGIGNWLTREVTGGLSEGEELVTSLTVRDLKPGARARVVEQLEAQ